MQLKANVMHACDYRGQNDRQSGVLSVQTSLRSTNSHGLVCHTKDFWMCGAIILKILCSHVVQNQLFILWNTNIWLKKDKKATMKHPFMTLRNIHWISVLLWQCFIIYCTIYWSANSVYHYLKQINTLIYWWASNTIYNTSNYTKTTATFIHFP